VLRPLHYASVDFEEVGSFECFEAEEIVVKIAVEIDGGIELFIVGLEDVIDGFLEEGSGPAALVLAVVELGGDLAEGGLGLLVEVVDGDAGSEDAVVGVDDVLGGEGSTM
jgi:hypothetical protein